MGDVIRRGRFEHTETQRGHTHREDGQVITDAETEVQLQAKDGWPTPEARKKQGGIL